MSNSIVTKQRQIQFRGPTGSSDYNKRVEENYIDLVTLKNQTQVTSERVREAYVRMLKDQEQLTRVLMDCEERLTALELKANEINFRNSLKIDTDRFNGGPYAINEIARCSHNSQYGIVTLPKVNSSSFSRLTYQDADGNVLLPSSLEARVLANQNSADSSTALIDTSDFNNALLNKVGSIWERNVIVASPHTAGARLTIYVKLPIDLFTSQDVNAIQLNPFPMFGSNLISVSYTTKADVVLNESDGYVPLNADLMYANNTNAVGHVPPGSWNGDIMTDYGPSLFYFDPKPITGVRIELQQTRFYNENAKYVYSYGLHGLDVRLDKFLSSGKIIVRFDAPAGKTISAVEDVIPNIYNVNPLDVEEVFSWRTIWETSYTSDVYTVTPVPNSQRVWIEMTLNQTSKLGTPAISSLNVEYS